MPVAQILKQVEQGSDIGYMRTKLRLPVLDRGKDAVVAMHSRGGIVGDSAVRGLRETERMAQ